MLVRDKDDEGGHGSETAIMHKERQEEEERISRESKKREEKTRRLPNGRDEGLKRRRMVKKGKGRKEKKKI